MVADGLLLTGAGVGLAELVELGGVVEVGEGATLVGATGTAITGFCSTLTDCAGALGLLSFVQPKKPRAAATMITAAMTRSFLLPPEPPESWSSRAANDGLLPTLAVPNEGVLASTRSAGGATTGLNSTGGAISRAGAGADAAPESGLDTGFLNAAGGAGCVASNSEEGGTPRAGDPASGKTLVFASGTGTAGTAIFSTAAEAAIAGKAVSNSGRTKSF
jgi:hypothetical protein